MIASKLESNENENLKSQLEFLKRELKQAQPRITEGSLSSMECFQPQGWFMRHFNFMILAQADDKSEAYKLATSWIIDSGLDQTEQPDGA